MEARQVVMRNSGEVAAELYCRAIRRQFNFESPVRLEKLPRPAPRALYAAPGVPPRFACRHIRSRGPVACTDNLKGLVIRLTSTPAAPTWLLAVPASSSAGPNIYVRRGPRFDALSKVAFDAVTDQASGRHEKPSNGRIAARTYLMGIHSLGTLNNTGPLIVTRHRTGSAHAGGSGRCSGPRRARSTIEARLVALKSTGSINRQVR